MQNAPIRATGEAMPIVASMVVSTTEPEDAEALFRQSQKFRKAGWYAFDIGEHRPIVVQYVEYDGHRFYKLSDGPSDPVKAWFSADAFDIHCIGYCQRVGADGRVLEIDL